MQWLRKIRVRFTGEGGSLEVNPGGDTNRQIYVHFDIEKTISGSANTASIEIRNLAESSRNAIGSEYTDVEIEAGYISPGGADLTGIIFIGQVRDLEHHRDSADIVTTVSCGDGDKAQRKATIAKTFPAGTTVEEVCEEIYAKYEEQGVELGEWEFPPMEPFERPYTIAGACSRELNVLGRSNKFYWSIQNNVMEIMPHDLYLPGIALISKDTGMEGWPKLTDNGVKVTALINPEVRPNRLIKVESEAVELNADNGEYRVGNIHYRGDNRDGDFFMTIHGEAIKGGVVNEGVQ